MTRWIAEKTNESKAGLFLILLLQSLVKNKNPEHVTCETLRAMSIDVAIGAVYSKVFTPRPRANDGPLPGIFDILISRLSKIGYGPRHIIIT